MSGSDGLPKAALVRLGDQTPRMSRGAWAAPGAVLAGDIDVSVNASIWYGAILRADGSRITIGEESNIQDGCVVHADPGFPVTVGSRVSVGHRAVLHGCAVSDEVLVGMGAVVLNGACIGSGSVVAAGSVVLEGMTVPAGSLVAGVPAKVLGSTNPEHRRTIAGNAATYVELKGRHAEANR